MNEDKVVIDEQESTATDDDIKSSVNISSLVKSEHIPMSLGISERDTTKGKEFCKQFIQEVIDAKLPDTIKNKPELHKLLQLQASFEEFTLTGMFSVVSQAVRLLTQLSSEDAIYTLEGTVNILNVQAMLAAQQNVMNLLAQFNTHIRRLPQVLSDMMRDIELSQVIQIEAAQEITEQKQIGNVTSKPMSLLLQEAEAELIETKTAEEAEQEPVHEPASEHKHVAEPTQEQSEPEDISKEDLSI